MQYTKYTKIHISKTRFRRCFVSFKTKDFPKIFWEALEF